VCKRPNPTAYFAAKFGVCTKPSVKILAIISINFVLFLAILFVTFEFYRNLAPDCQVKKPWLHAYFLQAHGNGELTVLGELP
jgi:hypothetical protein